MIRQRWVRSAIVNLFFAALHPWWDSPLPAPAASVVVNAVLFVVPALGWLGVAGWCRALGMRVAALVGLSTLVFLVVIALLNAADLVPTRALAWNATWLLTNLGFLVEGLLGRPVAVRRSTTRRELAIGASAFLLSYGLYYWGATRVVPLQVDHDLEVQATGYGLLTRFEPLLLTDRRTVYYFAHPPLLHIYAAGSFVYFGAFPALELYDAASRRARDARLHIPFEPYRGSVQLKDGSGTRVVTGLAHPDYLLEPGAGDAPARLPIETIELSLIYERYRQQPFALETRTPNIFFGATTVALLAIWAGRISRRWWLGVLTAAAYATSVEVFVRSSYGGYFAVGAFTTALMLLAIQHWRRWPRWSGAGVLVATGVLAALSDHKMVLLPAVAVAHAVLSRFRRGIVHPVAIGFGLGVMIFWALGLIVAPAAFIEDHFHHHLVDRITHVNPLGYNNYPTALAMWWEFLQHSAYLLVPAGLLMLIHDVTRTRGRSTGRAIVAAGVRPLRGLWLLWTAITAAVFSVIDWRMTKHLVPMLLPLHLGLVPDRRGPGWRTVAAVVVLVAMVALNAIEIGRVAADFTGYQITPAW